MVGWVWLRRVLVKPKPESKTPHLVNFPNAVWDRLRYESILRDERFGETLRQMVWRGLYFTERARQGWEIVFERESEDGGEERERLKWKP